MGHVVLNSITNYLGQGFSRIIIRSSVLLFRSICWASLDNIKKRQARISVFCPIM